VAEVVFGFIVVSLWTVRLGFNDAVLRVPSVGDGSLAGFPGFISFCAWLWGFLFQWGC